MPNDSIPEETREQICQDTATMQMDLGQMKGDLESLRAGLESHAAQVANKVLIIEQSLGQIATVREQLGCDDTPGY